MMIGIALMAAAAQAPVLLASNDEAQWRQFVRSSLQRPAAPSARARGGSRLMQLEGVVRRLGDDRSEPLRPGPYGL